MLVVFFSPAANKGAGIRTYFGTPREVGPDEAVLHMLFALRCAWVIESLRHAWFVYGVLGNCTGAYVGFYRVLKLKLS